MKATTVPNRRLLRAGPVLGALLVTGLLSACSSSAASSAGSPPSSSSSASPSSSSPLAGTTITLYNAQHEQTTSALIAAFTAQDRHQGQGGQ